MVEMVAEIIMILFGNCHAIFNNDLKIIMSANTKNADSGMVTIAA
jgi:hypothetical protein